MKTIICASLLCLASCAAAWHSTDRPIITKPVKCSDNWIPTTLDVTRNDETFKRKEQEDRIIWWLMISSVYFTSEHMDFAEVYNCEVPNGAQSLLKN